PDQVDDEREQQTERQGMREPDARPAAVEPGRVGRLDLVAEEADAVDEPLREHVRRVRAEQQRHERDLAAEVLLEDVWLEIVRRPAHGPIFDLCRSRLTSAGIPTTNRQRKARPSKNE